jgi:formate hydrogenlyase subunit 6/NADH:ubiquinone oxidoreductase subunit I
MNILTMMLKNLWGGSRTMRFPARPKVTEHYRGLVQFDPTLCTGCAICKFRCTSRAITFTAGKGVFTWSYDPGQCTFCGRCVEGCKSHALSQEEACPPIYVSIGELKKSYTVARKPPAPRPAPATPPAAGEPTPKPAAGGAQ